MSLPRLPIHSKGMRIGLFGGSFNPPHAGHRLVSEIALKRMKLDRVWWIVSPGNPLKNNADLPPLDQRMELCEQVAHHPKIAITGFEADIGTRYTYDTIAYLKARCPDVHFVWLMGADNLAGFHRWQQWQRIAHLVPIAVIDRPGSTLKAVSARAGHYLSEHRYAEGDASLLAAATPPALLFLHGQRSFLSSTAIRKGLAKP